jgi:hypothetical protein
MQSMMITLLLGAWEKMPPPRSTVELSLIVLATMINVPELETPPPSLPAELSLIVLFTIVNVPELEMAPPAAG